MKTQNSLLKKTIETARVALFFFVIAFITEVKHENLNHKIISAFIKLYF